MIKIIHYDYQSQKLVLLFILIVLSLSILIVFLCCFLSSNDTYLFSNRPNLKFPWIITISSCALITLILFSFKILYYALFNHTLKHILMLCYWMTILSIGIYIAKILKDKNITTNIIIRKWFHLLAFMLFLPSIVCMLISLLITF